MHSHYCDVCKVFVAACADQCVHDGKSFCSQHHPDPEHRIEDKPTVRMTVKIAD